MTTPKDRHPLCATDGCELLIPGRFPSRTSAPSETAPRHEIEWVIRSCLDENLMQLWAHKAKVEKIKEWLASAPSAIPRFQDQGRLEWVCERLAQHSMYIKQYDHAKELPRGGFAFYTNSTLLGYGETIVDAIDAAMKAEAANG